MQDCAAHQCGGVYNSALQKCSNICAWINFALLLKLCTGKSGTQAAWRGNIHREVEKIVDEANARQLPFVHVPVLSQDVIVIATPEAADAVVHKAGWVPKHAPTYDGALFLVRLFCAYDACRPSTFEHAVGFN
jgi:hypothetical protein